MSILHWFLILYSSEVRFLSYNFSPFLRFILHFSGGSVSWKYNFQYETRTFPFVTMMNLTQGERMCAQSRNWEYYATHYSIWLPALDCGKEEKKKENLGTVLEKWEVNVKLLRPHDDLILKPLLLHYTCENSISYKLRTNLTLTRQTWRNHMLAKNCI